MIFENNDIKEEFFYPTHFIGLKSISQKNLLRHRYILIYGYYLKIHQNNVKFTKSHRYLFINEYKELVLTWVEFSIYLHYFE